MDIGETLAQSAIREVKEETGFDVQIEHTVAIYSDPGWHRPAFMIAAIFRRILPKSTAIMKQLWRKALVHIDRRCDHSTDGPLLLLGQQQSHGPRATRQPSRLCHPGGHRANLGTPTPPDPAGPGSPRTSGYRIRGSRQGLIALMGRSRWMELQVRQTTP